MAKTSGGAGGAKLTDGVKLDLAQGKDEVIRVLDIIALTATQAKSTIEVTIDVQGTGKGEERTTCSWTTSRSSSSR